MSMMNKSVGILGTGSYAPDHVVTNFDLEKIVDTSDQWIRERTGIEERRIAPDHMTTSFMAAEAAKRALDMAGLTAEDINLIILATFTGDMAIPSTACRVQEALGATNAAAYDLGAACSGFVYGINNAAALINAGMAEKVLVIGAEKLSPILNWKDRSTCVLFGDGAGAAVLGQVDEGYGLKGFDMGADGRGGSSLLIPAGGTAHLRTDASVADGSAFLQMDGPEVYKFAVKVMGRTALNALEDAGMDLDQLDFFVPHQANKRIIDSAAKRLQLDGSKVMVNVNKYGNTSAASVGIALDEAVRSGRIKRGDNVAMAGFGAGLTWAGLVIKWF